MVFDKTGLFRHVTYSVIGANTLQKGAKYLPRIQPEPSCNENTLPAKESKQMILQTKLIIVEILNVSHGSLSIKIILEKWLVKLDCLSVLLFSSSWMYAETTV